MKRIKRFKVFESFTQDDCYKIQDRLIDFEDLGFETFVTAGSSVVLDFDRDLRDDRPFIDQDSRYSIDSSQIDKYKKSVSNDSITISLSLPRDENGSSFRKEISLNEIDGYYKELSNYLREVYDLKPNYVLPTRLHFIVPGGGGYGGQFKYYKDFEAIKTFVNYKARSPRTADIVGTGGFQLGFYK